jgi:hypothetical protein
MPLLDHFHAPLYPARHWESFHAQWLASIVDILNERLPRHYFAEALVRTGNRIEEDIITFAAFAETEVSMEMPLPANPGIFELQVFNQEGGNRLVAAIEMVSPANKDRPETRRTFATKCASLIYSGVGLMIIDIVTSRLGQMHNEFIRLMEKGDEYLMPDGPLYAIAYRPYLGRDEGRCEMWPAPLAVGQPLPTLPLPLDRGQYISVPLEATYMEACQKLRLT